jgi:hypothetical protein
MPTIEPGGQTYYYADGRKVLLEAADDLLAVDERRLSAADVSDVTRAEVRKAARPLLSGMSLLQRADLGEGAPKVVAELERARALQPVFRAAGAILVALPEVRVEETREAQKRRLDHWLASHAGKAEVEAEGDGRFVLTAASGYGGDALRLANTLTEQVNPAMAQPRFLRVTPRPSTMRG